MRNIKKLNPGFTSKWKIFWEATEPDKISKGKKLKCKEKPITVNYTDQPQKCKNNSRSNQRTAADTVIYMLNKAAINSSDALPVRKEEDHRLMDINWNTMSLSTANCDDLLPN